MDRRLGTKAVDPARFLTNKSQSVSVTWTIIEGFVIFSSTRIKHVRVKYGLVFLYYRTM